MDWNQSIEPKVLSSMEPYYLESPLPFDHLYFVSSVHSPYFAKKFATMITKKKIWNMFHLHVL